MVRFYTNENFPLPAANELRKLGNDVLTIQETGKANQALPDEAVLNFARLEGRILVTLNRKHFMQLHSANKDHAGIIVCTFDSDFKALAGRIHSAVVENSPMPGKLVRVNRPAIS